MNKYKRIAILILIVVFILSTTALTACDLLGINQPSSGEDNNGGGNDGNVNGGDGSGDVNGDDGGDIGGGGDDQTDTYLIKLSVSSNVVDAGAATLISIETESDLDANEVELEVTKGNDLCLLNGNVLYAAEIGECVVRGHIGDTYSNELVLSIQESSYQSKIALTISKTFVEKNSYADLTVTTSFEDYQYGFISGQDIVERYGRSLRANAKGTVKVVVYTDDYVSNIVTLQIVDPADDPYTNTTWEWFHTYNYNEATSLEDAYWRTEHNLMSGSIADQDQKPTMASNRPMSGNKYVRNSSSYYVDNGNAYEVVDSSGNVVNKIYKFGAYVTLEEVAAYVYAFGDVPANYVASNKTSSLQGSLWKQFLRLNHVYFSGDTSKYPYEPLLPRISGEGGDLDYYEIDIGTTGTDCDPSYEAAIYNDGYTITRGAARIVYTRYYTAGGHIDDLEERYVFYTYNHYNDFQEYLNYQGGWGKMFGNITGGGAISSKSNYNPTSYEEVVRRKFS